METKLHEKHYHLPSPFGLKSEEGRYAGKFVLLLKLLDESGRFFEGSWVTVKTCAWTDRSRQSWAGQSPMFSEVSRKLLC